jgi:hypothetical protein
MLTDQFYRILLPNGRDKWIKKRRAARYASKDETFLRCGNCGDTDFTVLVKPGQLGAAKVSTVACSMCNHKFDVDNNGFIGGTLTAETLDARQREEVNARPDT